MPFEEDVSRRENFVGNLVNDSIEQLEELDKFHRTFKGYELLRNSITYRISSPLGAKEPGGSLKSPALFVAGASASLIVRRNGELHADINVIRILQNVSVCFVDLPPFESRIVKAIR